MDGFWLAFDLDMVGDESVEKVGNCVAAPFGCSISGWILAIGHPAKDFLGLLPCGLGGQWAVSADGPPSLLVAGIAINDDEGLDAGRHDPEPKATGLAIPQVMFRFGRPCRL